MSATIARSSVESFKGLSALGTSSAAEYDQHVRIEGQMPAALRGTLYRNGPGLFERGGVRKRHLLDGDGMVQALAIGDGQCRYRSRFVATPKFVAEERAGKYLYPTWSTLAPGYTRNLGDRIRSQAGVTVAMRAGRLFAFDDIGMPFEVDPETLETIGEMDAADGFALPSYNAHQRMDLHSGEWIQFGLVGGRHTTVHCSITDRSGSVTCKFSHDCGRSTYFHDFFVTEHCVVFLIHALKFQPLKMLAGLSSVIDCLKWDARIGNEVFVFDRAHGQLVRRFEAPASFMWHALNAYERDTEIVADFVGYDEPDHFLGPNAEFATVMTGRTGRAQSPGTLRRYVMSLATGTLEEHIIDGGYHEFPMVNPALCGREHRFGYVTRATGKGSNFHSSVARFDMETGARDTFDFGPGHHAGEPVFAMNPDDPAEEAGWLLSEVLDSDTGKTFIAVFDARRVADGPLAKALLDHHVPLSFHGCWAPRH